MPWPGYTHDFAAQPLPQHIYAALQAIDEAVGPPMRRRSPSPAVPPGFEASVAARTAVTAAMTAPAESAHALHSGESHLSHSPRVGPS